MNAQCGSVVSTFPYNEGFETSAAWTSGGTASDWAWGAPAHPTISSAGGGTKSWCVGGLTGSFYNFSENSYLMSPCFDFTSLNYPWISFKIFWETELKWDGLTFQYSLDGGITWDNVGAYGDPVDCLNDNWFNHNNVSGLVTSAAKHGWSGRVGATSGSCLGGNGSGSWITAKHCMTYLSGQPNVRFRFLFGSGFSCNNYDGIAVDDILIQNADPNASNFSYTCIGSSTVNFTNLSSPCSTGYIWDFGDPGSGASSTSDLTNPSHTFSGPGTYTVSLSSFGTCNQAGISTQTITVLGANAIGTNVICNGGNTGTATALVTGTTDVVSYSWNTTPVQTTATATDLVAGTYTVDISTPGSCAATATVNVTEPPILSVVVNSLSSCTDICNGSLMAEADGGVAPYIYNWSTGDAVDTVLQTVCAGAYSLEVTDANGCSVNGSVTVNSILSPLVTCNSVTICEGSSAFLTATGASTYTWSPPMGLSNTTGSSVWASPSETTLYNVTGTSVDGCSAGTDVLVTVSATASPEANFEFFPQNVDVYHPEVNFSNTSTGATQYIWDFHGIGSSTNMQPVFSFPTDSGGLYQVCLIATNSLGCADTLCKEIGITGNTTVFVPNAFSPNGDGLNETFFPVCSDIEESDFLFVVFNRWGTIVYQTSSPFDAWDGMHKLQKCPADVYVWKLSYMPKNTGIVYTQEGHVTLLR